MKTIYLKTLAALLASVALLTGGVLPANAQGQLTSKCKTPTLESDSVCWLKVENHDDCYILVNPLNEMTVTWSGLCHAGMADGRGKMVYEWIKGESLFGRLEMPFNQTRIEIGSFVDGKQHGQWSERFTLSGDVLVRSKGSYVNGKKHGEWFMTHNIFGYDMDTCSAYSNGKLASTKDGPCY